MKFTNAVIAGGITFACAVSADDELDHPSFVPYKGKLAKDSFFEQFIDGEGWVASDARKDNVEEGETQYKGEWAVEESVVNIGYSGDKGLVVKSEAALHAISKSLPQVFDNKDNTLVLQYEVKLQKGLTCGGAYIKLLDSKGGPDATHPFSSDTPYQVMFGPDKCGITNKVHFIIRRKNPNTGEYEEKSLRVPPLARIVETSVLYTLIIKPDQDFEIRIDGEVARAGSLLDETLFLSTPKEIIDTEDKKPLDWVDDEYIPEPGSVKPDDWDEDAPYYIVDEDAVKPEDWDEDMPKRIPDPEDEEPEDWDEEEEGEWEPKMIKNPECATHGCGKWSPPKVINPDYKGKWQPELVKNPDYKGPWTPKTIPNPDYWEDKRPSDLEPIGSLGFELWTMTNSIMFDDIYLGHSIEEAETIGNATFIPKSEIERQAASADKPQAQFEPEEPQAFKQSPEESKISSIFDAAVDKAARFIEDSNNYLTSFLEEPTKTLFNRPGEAVLFSSVFLSLFSVIFGIWTSIIYLITGGSSAEDKPVEATSAQDKKKAEEVLENIKKEAEAEESETKASESEKNETKAAKRK